MYKTAIVTVSDSAFNGKREDRSGPAIAALLSQHNFDIVARATVPDEKDMISSIFLKLIAEEQPSLIISTGGTGFSPRDITPEATMAIIERPCPGIPEAMRLFSLTKTKKAMLSRATAGIRGKTLIINLPGSPTAVTECLEYLLDVLPHGLDILLGTAHDCAAPPQPE